MVEFFLAEGLIRGGAEPELPIEILRIDGLGWPVAVIVLPPVGSHLRDAAEAACLNHINGIPKVSPTALLHATLQNLLAGTNRVGKRCSFFDGVSDGFFQIHILPRSQSIESHAYMPVVGSRDDYGVDIFLENFAIIEVSRRETEGALLDRIPMGGVYVAACDDLIRCDLVGSVEKSTHTASCADDPYAKSVVGAENAG